MTRALLLSVACAAAALSAAPAAMAQSDERPQLRRLDWAGRPAQSGAELRRASPVIPHAGAAPSRVALRPAQPWRPTAGQVDGRQGLTPATAFYGAPAPTYAPPPVETPRPAPARTERAPAPQPAPVQPQRPAPVAPVPAQTAPQPVRQAETPPSAPVARLVQPSPVAPQPQPSSPASVDDPMAPRRDAPIFRIQGARQPQPVAPVEAPPAAAEPPPQAAAPIPAPVASTQPPPRQQGARYYSVHRQNGRAPDPTVLPEPVWLDRMPVQLDSTPQSEDLAAPPETPQMVRGADGRLRPLQGAQDDPIP